MTQTVLENEFDNEYGTMSMGMGPGRSFPDFEDYEQVLLKCISHCLKITQNVSFEFWHLSPIFVHILQVFKNCPKFIIVDIFNDFFNETFLWFSNTVHFQLPDP